MNGIGGYHLHSCPTVIEYEKPAARKMNVEQLRKAGYKVRVYHARQYINPDCFGMLSRKEFDKAYDEFWKFSRVVSSYGGFTSMEITTPSGETLKSKFNVPAGEQFNRKRGLMVCINRCFCERYQEKNNG